jgi:hypothetical protein
MDPSADPQQEWRAPLREAMDWLAERAHAIYETEAGTLLGDPWEARDRLGGVGPDGPEAIQAVIREMTVEGATEEEKKRCAELLEMERNTMRLFTSCGWFFDDLAGLEPVQNLRYAARVLELVGGPRAQELEDGFLAILEKGESNEAPPRDGRMVFLEEARPRKRESTDPHAPDQADESEPRKTFPEVPELSRSLLVEIHNLDFEMSGASLAAAVGRIRELATRHANQEIPIPFDAQTLFYRIIEKASPAQAELLSALREPLGFVSFP